MARRVASKVAAPTIEVIEEAVRVCSDCKTECVFVNEGYNCPECGSSACYSVAVSKEE